MSVDGTSSRRAARAFQVVAVTGVLVSLVAAPALLGNGGTLRLSGVSVGPYEMSVFTAPTPVSPDSVDVSVLILDPGRGSLAEGMRVTVEAEPVGFEAAPVRRVATREQADNPNRYYAAKFAVGATGEWRFRVTAEGQGATGTGSFTVRVRYPGLLDQPVALTIVLLLPLALVAIWMLRSGRHVPSAAAAKRRE